MVLPRNLRAKVAKRGKLRVLRPLASAGMHTELKMNSAATFDDNDAVDAAVLAEVISALRRVSPESRQRLIDTISTFFSAKLLPASATSSPSGNSSASPSNFGDTKAMTAKQFILEKEPRTDVERIACLAFYLTNYADTPHFKTLDLSRLNTEAAQPKFSNAAVSVENATKMGYLVPAVKGHKQLSGAGERFVQALPDRDAAKSAMNAVRSRIRRRTPGKRGEQT